MLQFDSLPAPVRKSIFLRLRPSDLNESLKVCSDWKDFVEGKILGSERYKNNPAVTTHRRALGKLKEDEGQKVEVETMWMLASCDVAEKMLYTLYMPLTGKNDWTLKRYSVDNCLKELNTVTLLTSNFIKHMEVVAGHLVFFKHTTDNGTNTPAVFNLLSIPWGGRLPLENSLPLPSDAFHFTKLLFGQDCLYVVSKNAHITWTKDKDGAFTQNKHENFADTLDRPVVVQKLTKQSGSWQDVAKIQPEHTFMVMEKYSNIPNKEPNPNYKDNTCLLYLSSDIITERYLLVCCPLHGSYEMFDYVHDFPVWKLNTPMQLPLVDIRFILKDAQVSAYHVLAAIRENYVFVYAEGGKATLYEVDDGTFKCQVQGSRFALSPRYVMSVGPRDPKTGTCEAMVTDSTSCASTPAVTFKCKQMWTDTFVDAPWYHDDSALGDFVGIVRQLPADRPLGMATFKRKAVTYWGYGHVMLDSSRMVLWQRQDARTFHIKTGSYVHQLNSA